MKNAGPAEPPAPNSPLLLSLPQWWSVLKGVAATAERANLALISGGVAYFGLMAVVPFLAALVALVGLFGDPALLAEQIEALAGVAPDPVISIVSQEVQHLVARRSDTLVAGAVFNLALALWSALQATRWMLMALTAVNRRAEKRKRIGRYLVAGVFTLYGVGLAALAVLAMAAAPLVLALLQPDAGGQALLLRWPLLGGAAVVVALSLYRWGPRRRPPPWRWLWPGALLAPAGWLLASSALTFALREFPAFGAAYGAIASAVALLLWLYLTALVFLVGGALNAELEFFALGRSAPRVAVGETIEPPIAVSGGQKHVTEHAPSEAHC